MNKEKFIKNPEKIVPLRYDEIFKTVFGETENSNNTAYLASLLLDIPYNEIEGKVKFKSSRHLESRARDKHSEKDLVFLLNLKDDYKINVEINMSSSGIQTIIERNYYYIANLFGGGLREGEEYTKIKTTIQYNLNNFYIDPNVKQLERKFTMKDEEGVLSSKLEIVHLNIDEMKNIWYTESIDKYDERMKKLICISALIMIEERKDFFKCLNDLEPPKEVKESIERIVNIMNDDDELNVRYYNKEEEHERLMRSIIDEERTKARKEAREEGIKEGKEEGFEQGIEQGQKEMLKMMQDNGISIKEISKITGFDKNKIEKMLSKN